MGGKNLLKALAVTNINLVERNLGHTNNFGHTLKSHRIGVTKVVHYHGGMTSLVEFYQCVGADESSSAGNKNVHFYIM